jgi:hypothetical protein
MYAKKRTGEKKTVLLRRFRVIFRIMEETQVMQIRQICNEIYPDNLPESVRSVMPPNKCTGLSAMSNVDSRIPNVKFQIYGYD